MRIGIYDQSSVGGINGVMYSAAVLAEALAVHHRVDLVHHDLEPPPR